MTKDGILELEQRRFKAMCDGDADALGALLHDGLTYTHSSGAVDSKASYTGGVRDKLWDYRSIKASDATVSLHGGAAVGALPPAHRRHRARHAEDHRVGRARRVGR